MIEKLLNALRLPENAETITLPQGCQIVPRELFLPNPCVARGVIAMESLGSLIEYTHKHGDANTCIFASLEKMRVESVIDWHKNEDFISGWGEHRAIYSLRLTKEWEDWNWISGKPLSQREFAEFIEEHLDEIAEPKAADVLTVATTLTGKRNVKFTNVTNLSNGDQSLQWEESTDAKGAGDTRVPTRITLAVPVFRGAEDETRFEVQAIFRYRIAEGKLSFEIRLLHAERVLDMAFKQTVNALKTEKPETPAVLIGSVTEYPRPILTKRNIQTP
jgi:uncharacterized protein YfdQ (DUF2303 family)